MNIVIVTSDQTPYAGYVLCPFFREKAEDITALVVIKRKKSHLLSTTWRRTGSRYVLLKLVERTITWFDLIRANRGLSVPEVAKREGIPVFNVDDINSNDTNTLLRELKPDLLVSVFASQIFSPRTLSISSKGCLNLHPSLLPAYAGVAPAFWVLAKGEVTTGVTLHYMLPTVDSGDVVLQKEITIREDDTVRKLYKRLCLSGAKILSEAVDSLGQGSMNAVPQDLSRRSYFSQPDKEAFKELLRRGRRLL